MLFEEYDINVLILYDHNSIYTNTVKEYLESFRRYSKLRIYYSPATTYFSYQYDLSKFDVVVIHYSVRLSLDEHLSKYYANKLKSYGGYKILFIQDEYDTTETARKWIKDLGVHTVFTCVPLEQVNKVYPKKRFPLVDFIPTLTGFVSLSFENSPTVLPLESRLNLIGYRGRKLPYWYGNLGQEKLVIGQEMKRICDERGIKVDIEWEDNKRIYGEGWYTFLQSCRATLGTESGSNVFDEDGMLRKSIEISLQQKPELTYSEVFERYVRPYEGKITMNQISPKVFEAISYRTALILFEGEYSEVIKADLHYIPLKKDFSNIEDVFKKLNNLDYIRKMTERAYQDIVLSGKYSYKKFISEFDELILKKIKKPIGNILLVKYAINIKKCQLSSRIRKKLIDLIKTYFPESVVAILHKIYFQVLRVHS